MVAPRVFVSSTAYDLGMLRGQLRAFITALGYEPVLSEYSDVLYDPRTDAQSSCLRELDTCDMLVLVVGGRLGSQASQQTLELVDLEQFSVTEGVPRLMDETRALSITQAEAARAQQQGKPIFTFVEQAVLHDHRTYEANREAEFRSEMNFGSISEPGTAEYIFSFISFLMSLDSNNAIQSFSRIEDVESHLRRQWSSLFQRLISESSDTRNAEKGIQQVMNRLDDLRAVMVSTAEEGIAREVAKGTLDYRSLLATLASLPGDIGPSVDEGETWAQMKQRVGLKRILAAPDLSGASLNHRGSLLEMVDGSVWRGRFPPNQFVRMESEWGGFRELQPAVRSAIYSVAADERKQSMNSFRPTSEYTILEDGTVVDRSAPAVFDPEEEPF